MMWYKIMVAIDGQYGLGGQVGQIADEMIGCGALLFAKIHINQLEDA